MDSLASANFWFGVAAGFCGGVIFLAGLALFASVDTTVMERRPTPYFTADYEPIAADEYDEEIVEGVAV